MVKDGTGAFRPGEDCSAGRPASGASCPDLVAGTFFWVNAVRFLQQYETSRLDYTAERADVLTPWQAEALVRQLGRLSNGEPRDR